MKSGKVSHLNHHVHRMQANRTSLGWDGSGLDPIGRSPCRRVRLPRQRGPQYESRSVVSLCSTRVRVSY
jgi:hypothetical protein